MVNNHPNPRAEPEDHNIMAATNTYVYVLQTGLSCWYTAKIVYTVNKANFPNLPNFLWYMKQKLQLPVSIFTT